MNALTVDLTEISESLKEKNRLDNMGIPLQVVRVPEMIKHKFHLRADLCVNLILPDDLTEYESKRLALLVSTLPFEVSL